VFPTWVRRSLWGSSVALIALVLATVVSADEYVAAVDCTGEEPVESTVSFLDDVQMVFDFNCVFCHQNGAENAGLNLEFGLAYAKLVDVPSSQSELPRIAPGDPAGSYLLHKISGTHLSVGGSGTRMPPSGPLPDRDLETLVTWVMQCAPDN